MTHKNLFYKTRGEGGGLLLEGELNYDWTSPQFHDLISKEDGDSIQLIHTGCSLVLQVKGQWIQHLLINVDLLIDANFKEHITKVILNAKCIKSLNS